MERSSRSLLTSDSGEPLVLYHATSGGNGEGFTSFRTNASSLGVHAGTVTQANLVAERQLDEGYDNLHTFKLYGRALNPLRMRDVGVWDAYNVLRQVVKEDLTDYEEIASWLTENTDLAPYVINSIREQANNLEGLDSIESDDLRAFLQHLGYDSIQYLNRFEVPIPGFNAVTPGIISGYLTGHGYQDMTEDLSYSDEEFLEALPFAEDSWMFLSPEQVKSVFDQGMWDFNNPDMRFQAEALILAETINEKTVDREDDNQVSRVIGELTEGVEPIRIDSKNFEENRDAAYTRTTTEIISTLDRIFTDADESVLKVATWYSDDMDHVRKQLAREIPEIMNEDYRALFSGIVGITSNGLAVKPNMYFAASIFKYLVRTGTFPWTTSKSGKKAIGAMTLPMGIGIVGGVRFNTFTLKFEQLEKLIKDHGITGAAQWLRTEHTGREILEAVGAKSISGMTLNDTYMGLEFAGQKTGPFALAIQGDESKLVKDRWWNRTWNRMLGTPTQSFNKPLSAGNVSDSPRGPVERRFMDEVVDDVVEEWNNAHDYQLTPSKVQAILWYNEKQLYRQHGLDTPMISYGDVIDERQERLTASGYLEEDGRGRLVLPGESSQDPIRVGENEAAFREEAFPEVTRSPSIGWVDTPWFLYQDEIVDGEEAQSRAREERRQLISTAVDRLRENIHRPSQGSVPSPYSGTDSRVDGSRSVGLSLDTNVTQYPSLMKAGESREVEFTGQLLTINPIAKDLLNEANIDTPDFLDISGETEAFHLLLANAMDKHSFGLALTLYEPEWYEGAKLYVTEDGSMGFAIKDDDIVSVFKTPDAGYRRATIPMMFHAVAEGGRRLLGFDTTLPYLYSEMGFRATSRVGFNVDYAPEGWDYDVWGAFNVQGI